MSDTKDTNPKDLIGSNKAPLHLWPTAASALGSLALLDGMLKYGRSNWRAVGVRPTIYVDALLRHVIAWLEGEEQPPDSDVHHLGHALACLAILVDAKFAGKLNDDRLYPGGYQDAIALANATVAKIKKRYEHRDMPKHYTIADAPQTGTMPEPGIPMEEVAPGRWEPRHPGNGLVCRCPYCESQRK